MRVLIVGAGVGGLATARAVRTAGHEARIVERTPALRVSGAAVTLWCNGTGVLADLGVDLDGVGGPQEYLEERDHRGRTMLRVEVGRTARRFGHPLVTLPRRRLLERLARDLPDDLITFGRGCTGVHITPHGAVATFDDGTQEEADVIVGADGHHSPVRTALWGSDPTRPSGWATWQGLSAIDIDVTRSTTGLLVVGRAGLCGLMAAGEGLLQWWFDVRWRDGMRPWASPVEELRHRFGHYAEPVATVLAEASDADIEFFPHATHAVPRAWGRGAATLVGDAAHTMPPTQAQGANQALEDAWRLGRELRSATTPAEVPAALRRYENLRAPRAARVARAAATESTNHYHPLAWRLLPNGVATALYPRWLGFISDYLSSRGADGASGFAW